MGIEADANRIAEFAAFLSFLAEVDGSREKREIVLQPRMFFMIARTIKASNLSMGMRFDHEIKRDSIEINGWTFRTVAR